MPDPTSAPQTAPSTPRPRRFGPDRIALCPVALLLLGSLPLAGSSARLNGLVLLPLACAVWVLRARVVVTRDGVQVCNGLAVTRVPWRMVEGFSVPRRGPVRLLRSPGRPVRMTALARRELPALRAAAQELGRDPAS